ncbi:microcephalin isoform X2 [Temnothorax americanus]|uniref:microcephalin isoform X2 n=1 Tax=Temnothorax americanus TaxID=1964332 RepID=UPI00406782C1
MSISKRKMYALDSSDEDDSFKHRRSSLKVNLSYSENLTDSGNGSLRRTEVENDEKAADSAQTVRRLSRNKSTYEKNRRSDPDNKVVRGESDAKKYTINNDNEMSVQIKEGIQLKRLTVNLTDISTKERYLETSCKRLKDAIMCKTKQIFEKENELSVKTAMVLGNRENRSASSTHSPNIGNETVTLDITDRHPKEREPGERYTDASSDRQKKDRYSNIVATPSKNIGRRSLEKTVDKSRLTQRRLFVKNDKQVEGQTKCKIIDDIVLKKNLPLLSLRRASQSGSPILSGSNRRLSLVKARSKLRSQNQFESHNNTYSTVLSVQNIDIGLPVVCSTFIEDDAMAVDKGIDNDADTSRATRTTNKVISMEMTEVYGGIRTSKEHVSLQNRNLHANNCNGNRKEEKSKEGSTKRSKNASGLEDVKHVNKITVQNNTAHFDLPCTDNANDQDVASIYADTTAIPMQVYLCKSIEDSAAVTKTRDVLQTRKCDDVNTSLDAVTETSKARKFNVNHRTNDANRDFTAVINKESVISNNQRESVNTIRTSLQMNTSVDSERKTWQRRSDKDDKNRNHSSIDTEYSSTTRHQENKETNDIDSLENISLIERLRNISMRNQIPRNDKLSVSKTKDEDKSNSSNSESSYSYVEGTPSPISRSVSFKSQLKHKTQHLDAATCGSNLNSMDNEENDKTKSVALHSKASNEMHMSTGTQKTIGTTTVTLEDTPSWNPFIIQNQLTVIEDVPGGTKSETGKRNIAVQNAERVPVNQGRRRLLPLNANSPVYSISPVEVRRYTPEESTSGKRKKRLTKKLPKRRSMRLKNNTNSIKRDTASKRMWSDSDCDIPKNKKKENKKTRKPRKVISKKICVKKFADESVLNILQRNRQDKEDHLIENGDSLDDFVKCRTISTQSNKYKSRKIVIVTTGLSKGDKSLVRSIVKSLGTAEVELNVSRRTTHVVSTGVRTVNLLRGIIRGCWLVPLEWVLKSLENNGWLDPETFEMKHFSKAVQENRKDRQLFGPSYVPELFAACGLIYVGYSTTVPRDTLKELIKTAGGYITEDTKLAKIIIDANGLKETWVIDSITTGELQLTKFYQRK